MSLIWYRITWASRFYSTRSILPLSVLFQSGWSHGSIIHRPSQVDVPPDLDISFRLDVVAGADKYRSARSARMTEHVFSWQLGMTDNYWLEQQLSSTGPDLKRHKLLFYKKKKSIFSSVQEKAPLNHHQNSALAANTDKQTKQKQTENLHRQWIRSWWTARYHGVSVAVNKGPDYVHPALTHCSRDRHLSRHS